jgi:hypothetical protein
MVEAVHHGCHPRPQEPAEAAAGEGVLDLLSCLGVLMEPEVHGVVNARRHAANDGEATVKGGPELAACF